MNIFPAFSCPHKSAEYLDDKRVIKMIPESAQMLSTAINYYGGKAPYKSTHVNHPCNVWVRNSSGNYMWLVRHFESLCLEYENRYNKIHKCYQYLKDFQYMQEWIPEKDLTPFPNCTAYKDEKDTHKAYKMYLNDKWKSDKRKPTWYRKTKENLCG